MRIFLYELKEKLDRKYVYIIFLFQLIFLVGYHLYHQNPAAYLLIFQNSLRSSLLVFICLSFLSYEIFCDLQPKTRKEILQVQGRRWNPVLIAKNMMVYLSVVIDFLVVLVIEIMKLSASGDKQILLANVIRVLVLNYALLPAVGVTLGKVFALISKRRWSGYLGLLIIDLLGCGLFFRINMGLYMTVGLNLDNIFRFFQFEQPNYSWVADYLYLVPAENYRFFIMGTWIAGGEALLCALCLKKKKLRQVMASVLSVVCILCVVCAANPGCVVNYDMNYGSASNKAAEFENDDLPEEKEAEFTIEKCTMDLMFSNEMEANVVLALGDEKTDNYEFTLYRGYQLTSVTDGDGNNLDYDRNEDYLTIYADEPLSEIHMSYHGYQQSFYSNSNAVMLPGYFAYYPQPGFRQVFIHEIVDSYQYSGFNVEEETLQETWYEIRTDFDGTVFSNLNREADALSGRTSAPTLMAGAAAEETRSDGHYIYPVLIDISGISLDEIKDELRTYCDLLNMDTAWFEKVDQVVYAPSSVYIDNTWGEDVIVDDCLFWGTYELTSDSADTLAADIVKQYLDVRGDQSLVETVLFDALGDSIYLQDMEIMDRQEFLAVSYDEEDPESESLEEIIMGFVIERMYLTLLETYDESTVMQRTVQYLTDSDSQQNSAEFMQALYLELEDE